VYVARACGIPEADAIDLDRTLVKQIQNLTGLQESETSEITAKRMFIAGRDGGLGYSSAQVTAPAAQAASWHICLPSVVSKVRMGSISILAGFSPWLATILYFYPSFAHSL